MQTTRIKRGFPLTATLLECMLIEREVNDKIRPYYLVTLEFDPNTRFRLWIEPGLFEDQIPTALVGDSIEVQVILPTKDKE